MVGWSGGPFLLKFVIVVVVKEFHNLKWHGRSIIDFLLSYCFLLELFHFDFDYMPFFHFEMDNKLVYNWRSNAASHKSRYICSPEILCEMEIAVTCGEKEDS